MLICSGLMKKHSLNEMKTASEVQEVSVMNNRVAVISVSGGMDSTGLLLNLLANKYKVYAISFYYGQKHKI